MAAPDWRVAGTYLESCNCDPICPCRTIAGMAGGRSTHGVCMGVLSWRIDGGSANGIDLGGLMVALALRYSDDEAGSPWDFTLYLDESADSAQREALEAIYTGRGGGSALAHFPWAWKPSNLLAVHPATIELDHGRRGRIFVRDRVSVRIARPVADQPAVTCVIPGHHRSGEEVIAEELRVDGELEFAFEGVCGYRSTFDYSSDEPPRGA